MSAVIACAVLLGAPPLLGAVAGLLQLALYRLAVALGMAAPERVPPFAVLWLRGLVAVVTLAAALGIWAALVPRPVLAGGGGILPLSSALFAGSLPA